MSSDTTEGTRRPTSLTFTPTNWNAPQTVTVTGVDDTSTTATQLFDVVLGHDQRRPRYAGLDADRRDRAPTSTTTRAGITVSPISGDTTEAGGRPLHGRAQRAADRRRDDSLRLERHSEGTSQPRQLTFTSANWNAPQTVTVTGVDDSVADGDQAYTIVFTADTSSDAAYARDHAGAT